MNRRTVPSTRTIPCADATNGTGCSFPLLRCPETDARHERPDALVRKRDAVDIFEFLCGKGRAEVGIFFREQFRCPIERCLRHAFVARLPAQSVDDANRSLRGDLPLQPLHLPRGKPELFPRLLDGDRIADQLCYGLEFEKILFGQGDVVGHSGARFLHQYDRPMTFLRW